MYHYKNDVLLDTYRFDTNRHDNSKEYKKNKVISKTNVDKQFISD